MIWDCFWDYLEGPGVSKDKKGATELGYGTTNAGGRVGIGLKEGMLKFGKKKPMN